MLLLLSTSFVTRAQDTGYISGTVTDKSGAAVAGAEVVVTNTAGSLTRTTTTNSDGAYVAAGLPGATYNIVVMAKGFQKYTAQNFVLDVAQKARVDVQLVVGAVNEEVVVTGESVAQVQTQSSEIGGTVNGTQIAQLQLNGRNFTQLATIVPGVSNQTGQDEGTVGVYGNVAFSFNGGRTEYNNWELDGGDNMDNGSNATLNVYPSVDAIAEFKVLTSNYGAQYGRNASGTVEVETKSGTKSFHGDVYYFGRNDFFNARNFFDPTTDVNGKPLGAPPFKKHDYGYTVGGPVFIPDHYNSNKQKTFFFWSEEWRRDLLPSPFLQAVPSLAERGEATTSTPGFGNFSDICAISSADCPNGNGANPAAIPIDPNAQVILDAFIPKPNAPSSLCSSTAAACFNASSSVPTRWREELVRVDHNFNSNYRLTVRYIHDSWSTVTPTTLWAGSSFPTIQTKFVGPGTSFVTRLNANISPTLLNEFVASYTADHIFLTNTGSGAIARPASFTMTGIFPSFANKLPGISINDQNGAYGGGFSEDPAYIPWNNANPTYTLRDNVTKVAGKHTFQFGAYAAIAQKNEQNSFGDQQGSLTFDASNSLSTGNAFADLLTGNVSAFSQINVSPKYYFRYQIAEPYFQDDWRITPRLTLNLGVRVSLFGTYREKFKNTFNFEQTAFNKNVVPSFGPSGELTDPTTGADLLITDPRVTNGVVQCGASGQPSGCVKGHLFNPGPRIGFAYDPWGNGKTAIRGGYGIFFEHGNGNEANVESLEATPPLVLNPGQHNVPGYTNLGSGGGALLAFPLGFNAIDTRGVWPYVQQWNLNIQHEFAQHFVTSIAYVGSKGTHLGLQRDLNQLNLGPFQNPYATGEAIGPNDCTPDVNGNFFTPSGQAISGVALQHLNVACGGDPNPLRPNLGLGRLTDLVYAANSNYHSLQASVTRSIAPLTLSLAYTYSHAIDNSSDRFDPSLVDALNVKRARASSTFDQRHMLNISYVYDLPFFRAPGLVHHALGGWQWSGITTIQTGTPFNVIYGAFSDNAGVANGAGPGTFADLVGNPHATSCAPTVATGPLLFNNCAFAAPRGLTFGDAGRSILHIPRRTNFDMSLLKNFKINETTGFQFRAEAFNLFNHTQWNGVKNDVSSPGDFLHPSGAHRARTLQFGLKFLF